MMCACTALSASAVRFEEPSIYVLTIILPADRS